MTEIYTKKTSPYSRLKVKTGDETYYIITENNDQLTDESGNYLIWY